MECCTEETNDRWQLDIFLQISRVPWVRGIPHMLGAKKVLQAHVGCCRTRLKSKYKNTTTVIYVVRVKWGSNNLIYYNRNSKNIKCLSVCLYCKYMYTCNVISRITITKNTKIIHVLFYLSIRAITW